MADTGDTVKGHSCHKYNGLYKNSLSLKLSGQ